MFPHLTIHRLGVKKIHSSSDSNRPLTADDAADIICGTDNCLPQSLNWSNGKNPVKARKGPLLGKTSMNAYYFSFFPLGYSTKIFFSKRLYLFVSKVCPSSSYCSALPSTLFHSLLLSSTLFHSLALLIQRSQENTSTLFFVL